MEGPTSGTAADIRAWAGSGAMALTGRADGPPVVAPAVLGSAMVAAADDLAADTARWGSRVEIDGPALLGERAALAGMTRRGDVSVGGAARFVRVRDGWIVLNLPRPDDVASLPALVGSPVDPDDWAGIAARLAVLPKVVVVEQAVLLGLAVGVPGSTERTAHPAGETHRGGPRTRSARPLVVDLTSLWAGPLLTSLLGAAGARVVKVEGRGRPDGARRGTTAFFDLLNHGKECLTADFDDRADVALLHRLFAAADLVVEGSRPRVMDRLGIQPEAMADAGTSWLSITAHGRTGFAAHRVGFGDDTAVAGGLYIPEDTERDEPPMFVADAVADPITALTGATVAAEMLAADRAVVVELPLARAAAWVSGRPVAAPVVRHGDGWAVEIGPDGTVADGVAAGDVVVGDTVEVAPPRARVAAGGAAPAGAHDESLREEFAALPGSGASGPGR